MKRSFVLSHQGARRLALQAIAEAPDGYIIEVKEPTRSLLQNAKLWALLGDVSRQVVWYGKKLSPESWKCVFSASLKKQDVVPGLNGDFVVLGNSTSKMSIREMGELMELIAAFGSEHDVRFTETMIEAA